MSLVAGFDNHITMKSGTTVTSGELTSWAGSNYTYTVPTGETGPSVGGNTLNSVEIARFNGNVLSFADAGYDRDQDFRIQHFVIKGFSNGDFNYIEDAENATNRSATIHNATNWQIRNASNQTNVASKTNGEWVILTIVRRSTANTYDAYIGSTKVADGVSSAATGSSSGSGSTLGSRQDLSLKGEFDLAEFVEYRGASMPLTEQQILDNISYLNSEWFASAFENTTPADGATDVSTTAQFDWADPENHNKYNLRVSETDFGTAIRDIFTTSKTHTLSSALDSLTQYFWKVRKYTPGSLVNVLLYNQQFTASDSWSDFNTQILSGNGSHVVESGKGIQRVNASTFAVADLQTTQISDVEITVEFDASDVTSDIQPSVHFRTQGTWLSNEQIEGYWVFWNGDTLQLGRTNADGGTSAFAGESLSFSRTIDTNVLVKILLEGFRIRVKAYTGSFPGYSGGIDFTDANQRFSSGGFSLKTAALSTASSNSEVRYDSLVFDEGVQLTDSVDSITITPSAPEVEPDSTVNLFVDVQTSGSFTGAGTWTKQSGVTGITIQSQTSDKVTIARDGTVNDTDTAVIRWTSDEDSSFEEVTVTAVAAAVVSGSRANDEATLVNIANTLNYQTWDTNTGWDGTSMSLSDTIHGVTTDTIGGELRVTRIRLFKNGIDATNGLPVLDDLTEMEYFNVMFNTIAGPLPQFVLTKCKWFYLNHSFQNSTDFDYAVNDGLDLHDKAEGNAGGGRDVHPGKNDTGAKNKFTGELYLDCPVLEYVACAWTNISGINNVLWTSGSSLKGWWFDNNAEMKDKNKILPSDVGNHTNTSHIGMGSGRNNAENSWGGSLPASLSNLVLMYSFRTSDNFLTGPLPDLSSWDNIQTFTFGFNRFESGWPIYFIDADRAGGPIGNLNAFSANWSGDSWSDAVLPSNLPNTLRSIIMPQCGVTGNIPQMPNQMINTDFSYNDFTSITEDWTNLTKIRNVRMSNCPNLTGNVSKLNWLKPSTLQDLTRGEFANTGLTFPSGLEEGREYDHNAVDKGDSGPIIQKTRREWYEHYCIFGNTNRPNHESVFSFSAP